MKAKILKRIAALLCAISMSTSVVINSVGAVDTSDAEAEFSMQYMNALPKPGEGDFDKFSGKYERDELENKKYNDKLQHKRKYDVKYPNGDNDFKIVEETIDEKIEYEKVRQKVEELKRKVKNRTPDKTATTDAIKLGIENKEISKHHEMPEKMRLAKAIYLWVSKEIKYDMDSLKNVKGELLRKPQVPLYVFAKRIGVCAGKANLVNLMMRMAGIPSVVIASKTHAFNAVYLKDTTSDREGWILVDATWGSSKSDMSLQTDQKINQGVDKEKISKMVEGRADLDSFFARENFAMYDDEYAQKIDEIIFACFFKYKDNVKDFNKELEASLKKLNDNNSGKNGFKFKNIRLVIDKGFLLEYETNVKQDKAEVFYKNLQEERKLKDLLAIRGSKFSVKSFDKLIEKFTDKINNVNIKNNSSKLTRSKEYCEKLRILLKDLLKNDREEITNKLKKDGSTCYKEIEDIVLNMNQKIRSGIEELNKQYSDIVKIQSFNIDFKEGLAHILNGEYAVEASMGLDLSLEETIKIVKKQSEWSNRQEFFSGFYDKEISFKCANENMIDYRAHKIEQIVCGDLSDKYRENSNFDLKIDGVTYKVSGEKEGELKSFELTGDKNRPLENVKISPNMVNLGVPFKISEGIKSVVLQGNEIINLCYAWQLKSIDVTDSKAYILENGVLYEKNSDNSQGRKIDVPNGILIVNKNSQTQ